MKFTITKALDKIALIKFFRSRHNEWIWNSKRREIELSLKEAHQMVTDLPLVLTDLTRGQASDLKRLLANWAEFNVEEEFMDQDDCKIAGHGGFNYNISPSPETEAALLWFNGLSDVEKNNVRVLSIWLTRAAVC